MTFLVLISLVLIFAWIGAITGRSGSTGLYSTHLGGRRGLWPLTSEEMSDLPLGFHIAKRIYSCVQVAMAALILMLVALAIAAKLGY